MKNIFRFLVLLLLPLQVLSAIDVSMSVETGKPNPIVPGEVTALHITILNNRPNTVTGVEFINTMPAELKVAGSGLTSYSCVDGDGNNVAPVGTASAVLSSRVISVTGGTIPAAAASSGRCDIVVEVTSTVQNASHINTIPVGDVTGTDGGSGAISNSSKAEQSITVLSLNNPTISKNFDSSSVVKNDETVRLTITIDNRSNNNHDLPLNTVADTPAFGLQDELPVGLEVAAIPNNTVSCTTGSTTAVFSPVASDTTLTIVGGAIPANAACSFFVDVVGTSTGGGYSQALTNIINRTTQFANKRGLVPSANASDTLTVRSALQVSKVFSPTTIRQSENATLTITLTNASPINALTGVILTENNIKTSGSGAGTLAISATSLSGCGAGNIATVNAAHGFSLTGATIAANTSCVITLTYAATLGAVGVPETFTDTIAEGDVTNGQGAISQPASHSVTVVDELTVSKSQSPATVSPGNPVRYQVAVNNYAPNSLSNVRISDSLPGGILALETPAPSMTGGGCSGILTHNVAGPAPSTATPQFTFNMNAGSGANPASCTVTFWAMVPEGAVVGATFSNVIAANGVCSNNGDTNAICNAGGSNTVTTTAIDPLTVSKNFVPNNAFEGTVSELTVVYSNSSAQPMTATSFTDNLPLGTTGLQLEIANPANASSTCSNPVITAIPGASSVTMTDATIPARANAGLGAFGTCELKLNVIGGAGSYTNILPAAAVTATQTLSDNSTIATSSIGPVQAIVSYTPALTAAKSFSPSTVQTGGFSTVALRLGNIGTGTLNNISVSDPLPANMTIADPSNAHTTCGGTTAITALVGASSASMSGAVIPPSGECEFLFDVITAGSGPWNNSIPEGNITADGGIQNITAVSAILTESSNYAITVTNNVSPNSLTAPGETSVLTITLLNNGTLDLDGIDLTDYFTADGLSNGTPTGMVIAATPNASTTCSGGVAVANGNKVALASASLSAGDSCTVSVNITMLKVGTIQDTIPVGVIVSNQGASNTLPSTTSLSAQARIGVIKEFIPAVVKPGERSRLRLTFINPLALPVTVITTADNLPTGMVVPAGANPTTTCSSATVSSPNATTVQVVGGILPAATGGVATTCIAEIDIEVAVAGSYSNIIPVGGVTGMSGGSPVDNPSSTTAVLEVRIPLTINKAFSPSPVLPGVSSQLTITLTNPNTIPITSAAFSDALPSNLVVALTPNGSTTCVGGIVTAPASATEVSLAGATIPATGACTVTVDVLSNTSGVYTNIIPASAVSTAEGITNEEPTTAELIVSTPPAIDKQFSPAVISAGGTSTLTLVFGNENDVDISLSSIFTDTLPTVPDNIVVAATPNVVTTCPGAVTAVAGSGTVSYANAAVIPTGGCSISVDVTGLTAGEHINTIPVGALQTNVGINLQSANSSLLISPLGYIAGRVYQDNNTAPNGSYENGIDTPILGTTIELHSDANCSGAPIATTVTDSLGNYLFAELAAGTYSVCEVTQPAGTTNGITTPGLITSVAGSTGTSGSALNPTAITSQITGIVLNADGGAGEISGSNDNNFAEIVLSSISGAVFLDQNNNGVQNGADTAIAGVTIELLDSGNNIVASTVTDASGAYNFTGLQPGNYSVREPVQPEGTANGQTIAGTVANGGTAGTASISTVIPSVINTIVLPPNTVSIANNFAEIPNSRRISGKVFLDFNDNSSEDGSDHGISGQTIDLTGTDVNGNSISVTTTTASDGTYTFDNLPEGTYTIVQQNQPTNTNNGSTTAGNLGGVISEIPSTIATVNLAGSNKVAGDNDFAEIPDGAVDLAITKSHSPATFGAGSNTGFYTITPSNIGTQDTSGAVTIVDTLPTGMSAFSWPTAGDWVCNVAAQTVTCSSSTVILAGETGSNIILRVAIDAGLADQTLVNNVVIEGGSESPGFEGNNNDSDPTGIADAASVEGHVWRDVDHDRVKDVGEEVVEGWIVELLLNDQAIESTLSDVNGHYAFSGLAPGSGYRIQFREPSTGAILGRPVTNETGTTFTNGVTNAANPTGADNSDGSLNNLTLLPGVNTPEQSLPLDPSGVVYDSVTRQPIVGATVTLVQAGVTVPTVCLVGGTNPQITGDLGFYQFLLVNPAPIGCPGDATYSLQVTQPTGYLPPVSTIIAESVPSPHTPVANILGNLEAVQAQPTPPTGSQPTTYYLGFNLSLVGVGVVNNHIPIDPVLEGAIAVAKTTTKTEVIRGELVPYTITATNTLSALLANIDLQDQVPAGFKYVDGSARLDGVSINPTINGRILSWEGLTFAGNSSKTIQLILIVGSGVSEGEYVNQAWAMNSLADSRVSNVATATVRVVPDPLFDCSDLIGKVFDDKNVNGYQDEGEPGLAGVRVVTVRGLLITTDDYGRFHLACADVPNELHGSNFIMKLDTRTLPSGYRVTTENPRVVRLTRGKLVKLNFGAALHRMLRIDIDQTAFNTEGDQLSQVANAQLSELVEMLKQQPSQMRLSYTVQVGETESDAKDRMQLFADALTELWQQCDCDNYALTIEQEILTREKRMTTESATGRVK